MWMGRPLEAMDRMSALRVRDVTMIAAMGVAGEGADVATDYAEPS